MNCAVSTTSSSLSRRRLVLGILVLLLVDVIWVASSELTSLADACAADGAVNHTLSDPLYVPVKFHDLQNEKILTTNDDKCFVGLFNLLLLWPGFFLLHYTKFEAFEFPNKLVWIYLVINGLVGTVLSEFLWLWGCFLTSSLVGTLALSLTIPLSIIADICMQKVRFSWVFFAGALPVFISFFIVTLLCHYNNWDPVMVAIRRIFAILCRKHRTLRTSEDEEQSESLISLHNLCPDEGSTSCS